MLKLAGEFIEGQLADHAADLDAHTKSIYEALRTGEYYCNLTSVGTGIALTADTLYSVPLIVARAITVDRIACEVTTAGAASTAARLGIYNNGTNLHPGALLLDAGTVAVDSTGVKAITINQALSKGIYHLAIISDGAPSARGILPEKSPLPILGIVASQFYRFYTDWSVAQTYGALPDPFPSATLGYAHAFRIMVRVASLD